MITIESPEAERLAREQSARTGESVKAVVLRALREQAAREAEPGPPPPSPAAPTPTAASPWALLDQMAGSVDAPPDWSEEYNHYLYGVPKHGRGA